jgi:hypothetical protein
MKRYTCWGTDDFGMEENPDGDFYRVDEVEALLEEIMFQLFTFESAIAYPED